MPTPRLGIDELSASQAGKEESVNRALRALEQGACLWIVIMVDELTRL